MGYNLLINGVYWGYNPLTNHLLTSWDIQVPQLNRTQTNLTQSKFTPKLTSPPHFIALKK